MILSFLPSSTTTTNAVLFYSVLLCPVRHRVSALLTPFSPFQEAQEMREDDDLKRATELSLQGWNKDSEYFVCNLKGFKIMALRISDYYLLAARWWSRLETHLFKMAYPLWLTLFYIIYLFIFNLLLYCICFIFITCPWVLRKALKNVSLFYYYGRSA